MACLRNCIVCGQGICDATYCSQECAAAPAHDLLARIKKELLTGRYSRMTESQQVGCIFPKSIMEAILKGKWLTIDEYLEQKKKRDFEEGQRAMQRQLEEMEEFNVAQEAIRKLQEKRMKRRKRKTPPRNHEEQRTNHISTHQRHRRSRQKTRRVKESKSHQ